MDVQSRLLTEATISEAAGLKAQLQLEMAQLERRMTKWMFICAIGTFGVAVEWTMVFQLRGAAWPALALVVLGTAGQVYAVWRM